MEIGLFEDPSQAGFYIPRNGLTRIDFAQSLSYVYTILLVILVILVLIAVIYIIIISDVLIIKTPVSTSVNEIVISPSMMTKSNISKMLSDWRINKEIL